MSFGATMVEIFILEALGDCFDLKESLLGLGFPVFPSVARTRMEPGAKAAALSSFEDALLSVPVATDSRFWLR